MTNASARLPRAMRARAALAALAVLVSAIVWVPSIEARVRASGAGNCGPFAQSVIDAVDGNILIYVHKEQELADVERRYPAEHYVLVDDKVRILTAIKNIWGERVTTVFPRQGHYALDTEQVAKYPAADITVERIGDILAIESF